MRLIRLLLFLPVALATIPATRAPLAPLAVRAGNSFRDARLMPALWAIDQDDQCPPAPKPKTTGVLGPDIRCSAKQSGPAGGKSARDAQPRLRRGRA